MNQYKDEVEFAEALGQFLLGQSKQLAIVASLSVAVNTAILEGVTKMDLQKKLVELYDIHDPKGNLCKT